MISFPTPSSTFNIHQPIQVPYSSHHFCISSLRGTSASSTSYVFTYLKKKEEKNEKKKKIQTSVTQPRIESEIGEKMVKKHSWKNYISP